MISRGPFQPLTILWVCDVLLLAQSAVLGSKVCPAACWLVPFCPSALAPIPTAFPSFSRAERWFFSLIVSCYLCDCGKQSVLCAMICGLKSSWAGFMPSPPVAVCLAVSVCMHLFAGFGTSQFKWSTGQDWLILLEKKMGLHQVMMSTQRWLVIRL